MNRKMLCLTAVALVTVIALAVVYPAFAQRPGQGKDRVLTKVKFIHFRKARGRGRPPGVGGGKKQEEGYYSYLAKGAKWRAPVPEDLQLNPYGGENPDGSLNDLIQNAAIAGINEWETPDEAVFDILGGVLINADAAYDDDAVVPQGYNSISFANLSDPQVIAVAVVWGYFSGPPSWREIIEAHIVLNDSFEWGNATGADGNAVMDLQNILTHELGHCVGMGDVYESAAANETMYGWSTEGETQKRDLYKGDITGVTKLYK